MNFTKMHQIHEIHENANSHWCCPKLGKSWHVKMRVIGREKAVIGHGNRMKNVHASFGIFEHENHENHENHEKHEKHEKHETVRKM